MRNLEGWGGDPRDALDKISVSKPLLTRHGRIRFEKVSTFPLLLTKTFLIYAETHHTDTGSKGGEDRGGKCRRSLPHRQLSRAAGQRPRQRQLPHPSQHLRPRPQSLLQQSPSLELPLPNQEDRLLQRPRQRQQQRSRSLLHHRQRCDNAILFCLQAPSSCCPLLDTVVTSSHTLSTVRAPRMKR